MSSDALRLAMRPVAFVAARVCLSLDLDADDAQLASLLRQYCVEGAGRGDATTQTNHGQHLSLLFAAGFSPELGATLWDVARRAALSLVRESYQQLTSSYVAGDPPGTATTGHR